MLAAKFARGFIKPSTIRFSKNLLESSETSLQCCCKRTKNRNIGRRSTKAKMLQEMFRKKAKKTIDNLPVLQFTPGMTVEDVAMETNKTSDEVIKYLRSHSNKKLFPYSEIQDVEVLRGAFKGENLRVIIKHKKKEIVKRVQDIYRRPPPTDPSILVSRPPIVTVMGHVDHGKTTLLDSLRKTSVAQNEAGGITQAIGAFTVKLPDMGPTTFIDTPGHAAFSAMRQRGVQATDIVVLVVAADDGVMPQTRESIQLAETSGASIVVAINKCDLKNVDTNLVLEELSENGIVVEKLGGKIQSVRISALKGKGLDKLVEAINLQAGFMDITADPTGLVEAVVLETRVEKGRGFVASAIVQRGTLKKGQILVAGKALGMVQAILDENNKVITSAPPGVPVSIVGWKSLPEAGQVILEAETRARALEAIECRKTEDRMIQEEEDYKIIQERQDDHRKIYIDQLQRLGPMKKLQRFKENTKQIIRFNKQEKNKPEFNIIIKADCVGSLVALEHAFDCYDDQERCEFNVVSSAVGNLGEADLKNAEACQGIIYLFNVTASKDIMKYANELDLEVIQHQIIYRILDDIRGRIFNLLPEADEYQVIGEARVMKTFKYNKLPSTIGGCEVTSGCLLANERCRVLRDDEEVYLGELVALKHVKKVVEQVNTGSECGLRFKNDFQLKIGDIVQSVHLVKNKIINWDLPGSQDSIKNS